MYLKKYMQVATKAAEINMERKFKEGGPFGAVITRNGHYICSARNQVLRKHDPTAHGEVECIRKACEILQTHDLSDCELYTSAYPCPMCLGAIMWANIKTVYYANSKEDTDDIGFKDDKMYEVFKGNITDEIQLIRKDEELGKKAFETFKSFQEQLY